MTSLTKRQKAFLSQLARKAWNHLSRTADEPLPEPNTWRRDQVFAACGKAGLSAGCDQGDYNPIAARLHSIMGEDGKSFEALLRAGTEWRRQAEVVLLRALESAGLPQSYAESICRSRFGVTVCETSDAQFRMLLMTVKARARAKRGKQMEAAA